MKKTTKLINVYNIRDIEAGTLAVGWVAVSYRNQRHKGYLQNQIRRLRKTCKERGIILLKIFTYVGQRYDPPQELLDAAEYADEREAILVGDRVDRFIRHRRYHSGKRPHLQAGSNRVNRLVKKLGVPVATVIDPKANAKEVARQLAAMKPKKPRILRKRRPKRLLGIKIDPAISDEQLDLLRIVAAKSRTAKPLDWRAL